ncbi:MAG: hypothetical protein JRH16_19475 [Deltaproteobacteria bacterium]|nr:hypothetical protein [Deltaproteobacteria bacterium]
MKPRGSFKIANRRPHSYGPLGCGELRIQRIVDSLRAQITGGGPEQNLRIRRVFQQPREIYRLELEIPELGFQRTTLLDRDALEELLTADEVRQKVEASPLEG